MNVPQRPDPRHTLGIEPHDLERLVDSGPMGYLAAGPDGVILRINETAANWLGRERHELVGEQTFQRMLAAGGRIYYDTHIRPLLDLQDEVKEIALDLIRADGSRMSVLANFVRRSDPVTGAPLTEVVLFDAEERRRYERELLRERQHAERSEALLQFQYDVVGGLAMATTADEVVAVIAERSSQSFGGARCAVWLFEGGDRSAIRLDRGDGPEPSLSRVKFSGGGPALDQLQAGELVVIDDREATKDRYPLICHWLAETGRGSAIIAPLTSGDGLHGVLSYGLVDPHRFDETEFAAVRALAGQTGQALRRTWLLEAEQQGRERLENLFRFTTLLSEVITLDRLVEVMTRSGVELLGAVRSVVALVDEFEGEVSLAGGIEPDGLNPTALTLDARAIACEAIRSGDVVCAADRDDVAERFPASPILGQPEFGRVIALPLKRRKEVLGAWILVFAEHGLPEDEEITLVRLFADQAGLAARRAANHELEVAAREQSDLRRTISQALNRSITPTEVGNALCDEGRRAFDADAIAVYYADTDDRRSLLLVAHDGLPDELVGAASRLSGESPAVAIALTTLAPHFVDNAAPVTSEIPTPFADHHWRSVALLPLVEAGEATGLVVVLFGADDDMSTQARVALSGMAAEASVAIGRARTYELERRVAVTLQQSMLPSNIPAVDGWNIDTWYAPGSDHLLVGGDLFDVTALSNGRIVVVVADVVGRGLGAAAAMGQLRSAAKSLALSSSTPAEILTGLDEFAGLTPRVMHSSVCCVVMEADGTGRYASAGHPYPVIVGADKGTVLLEAGRSPLLGVATDGRRADAALSLMEGSTLVLYTDGLVERRDEPLDLGIDRLRRGLATIDFSTPGPHGRLLTEIIDQSGARSDDVAVVCLTRSPGVG